MHVWVEWEGRRWANEVCCVRGKLLLFVAYLRLHISRCIWWNMEALYDCYSSDKYNVTNCPKSGKEQLFNHRSTFFLYPLLEVDPNLPVLSWYANKKVIIQGVVYFSHEYESHQIIPQIHLHIWWCYLKVLIFVAYFVHIEKGWCKEMQFLIYFYVFMCPYLYNVFMLYSTFIYLTLWDRWATGGTPNFGLYLIDLLKDSLQ